MKSRSCEIGSLTHWDRVTHICVGNLTIIDSDNGLSPGRRQAITWTNVGILLIGPLGRNFNEMLIKIHTFSYKKIHSKMSSGKWRPFCLSLNVLNHRIAWNFYSYISSSVAEVPVKLQSNRTILNTNLAASRLRYLTLRRLFGYWNRALCAMLHK